MKAKLITLLMFVLLCANQKALSDNANTNISLFTSRPYICKNYKNQWFEDSLPLKPGQETLPLTLTVVNGVDNAPAYKWLRVTIGGYLLASEQDFQNNSRYAVIDVSGKIQPGTNQVIIEAGGAPGASLSWRLATKPIYITGVQPANAMAGGEIVIRGENFSSTASQNVVYIGEHTAQIVAAQSDALTVKVPPSIDSGTNEVRVIVSEIPSNAASVNVSHYPAPYLDSLDVWMIPPGATLTITGKNFANDIKDNRVFFGRVESQITYASPTEIQVTVPEWNYGPGQLNIPVSVVSKNVPSVNTLPIDIGPKYQGDIPVFAHD